MKSKSFTLLFVLCIGAAVTGCATPKYNYAPKTESISEPPLNTVVTVQVGDHMVRQGSVTEHDAILVKTPITVGAFSAYTITPGYFKKTGEDEGSEYYIPYAGKDSGAVSKNPISDPWKSIEYAKTINEIGIITVFNLHVMVPADGVSRVKKSFESDDSFQQTLIYSGKVGNKIRLGYREFSNNLARPAFNNDVEYDLNESNVVGYKGARIEIIEANNQYIKYKLLQNFKSAP
ncbi:MAG TPA: hypothetical protein PKD55_15685 [Bellilinea sp.]|nr:hypothetical protein [Bellilinea sp.]